MPQILVVEPLISFPQYHPFIERLPSKDCIDPYIIEKLHCKPAQCLSHSPAILANCTSRAASSNGLICTRTTSKPLFDDKPLHWGAKNYSGYNLKRKIASLPPISVTIFDRNVTKLRNGPTDIIQLGQADETDFSDTKPPRTKIERGYAPVRCLFCNFDSQTLDDNVEHMFKVHGLFIPNQEDLEDAEGLLCYLFTVISDFRECLYCGKTKETVEGIRSHMVDKGHCKLAFDEELDQFYDFENGSDDGAEEQMIGEAKEHVETERTSPPHEHDFHPDTDNELHLPSGRILGHRSLSRYYRQNLHSYPTAAERGASRAVTAAEAANSDNPMPDHPGCQLAPRSRGEWGMIGVSEFEKRVLRGTEQKALKQEARAKNQHEWRVNKESNHQEHYRVSGLWAPVSEQC